MNSSEGEFKEQLNERYIKVKIFLKEIIDFDSKKINKNKCLIIVISKLLLHFYRNIKIVSE